MAYTLAEIEWLHDNGKMPDWIYYQLNEKSLTENYHRFKQQQRLETMQKLEQRRRQAQAEKELEEQIEKKATAAIEKALEDLLKDFSK